MRPTEMAPMEMRPTEMAPMDMRSREVHSVETETTHVDDSMNSTTITASTIAPLPEFHPTASADPPLQEFRSNIDNNVEHHRPQTSYSDTGFSHYHGSLATTGEQQSRFNSPSDTDTPPRHGYYDAGRRESQQGQPYSRPNSNLGHRYPVSEGTSRSVTYQEQNQRSSQPPPQETTAKNTSVVIKVGMVGDAQIGKTSLMVKYVEGSWDEDYIQTLGVNFMEKTISIRNTEITFSIWDLGGQREFVNMLPLVCNDAVAILFMFDLTRKSTLNSIKEWYRQGRGFNKTAIPFLVGTKYDHFVNFPREEQEEISNQAKRFAKAMKASLIFSSTSHSINVQKIFKIVLSKAFDLKCTIPEIENIGEPLLLYQSV
ncbi:small GTPase [Delitschia confertaspora ATCC 74209]|uniref:Small GTPase n=1 Tax=Delitschia confertaspora ATCC 74209 TaxID=1513339 RepID=A0A9P4JBE7_9PLEO|nr:small GTPase [Delitschia confertaspora ATCC 74209]